MLFINSQQCFSFTIRVIKNSDIVLSAISCWSDNGRESMAEAEVKVPRINYSPAGVRVTGGEGAWRKPCFSLSLRLPTGDDTQKQTHSTF